MPAGFGEPMPRKRSSTTPTRKSQAAAIAKLRKAGVTRSQAGKGGKRLGGSAYALLKNMSAVLQGKAAVVSASPETIKRYKNTFKTTRKKIIVPKAAGEKVRITKGVVTKRKIITPSEPPISVIIPPKLNALTDLPRGPGIRYRVNYGSSRILFETFELLDEFLSNYGGPGGKPINVGFIEVIPRRARGRVQRGSVGSRTTRVVEDDEGEEE